MKSKSLSLIIVFALLFVITRVKAQTGLSPVKVNLQLISDQLSYPTAFAAPNDKSGSLFICEQKGRIRIIKNGKLLSKPFLDFTDEVLMMGSSDEMGLLGLAFHPQYAENGKFYVYFSKRVPKTPGIDHQSIIREYKVSTENPDLADKTKSRDVLIIDEPESLRCG
jgi:glucose/arabinose dehydrogenase